MNYWHRSFTFWNGSRYSNAAINQFKALAQLEVFTSAVAIQLGVSKYMADRMEDMEAAYEGNIDQAWDYS